MKKRFFSIVLSLVMALSTMINAYAAFDYGDVTADSILTAEDSALILQKVMNSESSLPVEAESLFPLHFCLVVLIYGIIYFTRAIVL